MAVWLRRQSNNIGGTGILKEGNAGMCNSEVRSHAEITMCCVDMASVLALLLHTCMRAVRLDTRPKSMEGKYSIAFPQLRSHARPLSTCVSKRLNRCAQPSCPNAASVGPVVHVFTMALASPTYRLPSFLICIGLHMTCYICHCKVLDSISSLIVEAMQVEKHTLAP